MCVGGGDRNIKKYYKVILGWETRWKKKLYLFWNQEIYSFYFDYKNQE